MYVDLISALVRGLSFIALFQAAGTAIFIAGFGVQIESVAPVIRRLGFVAALAALALVSLHYSLEAARMAGALSGVLDRSLQQWVFESPAGTAWGLRAAGLAFLAFSFNGQGAVRVYGGVVGAAIALAAFMFVGHTVGHGQGVWLTPLLSVHVAIVAFWFGALAPLHIISAKAPAPEAAAVIERFSAIAVWSVPIILLAGAAMAALLLERWSALAQPYGLILLGKAVGFAALMGLAALNRRRYGPAIVADPRAGVPFRRTVSNEYALMSAVLIATAFMTTFFSPY